MELREKYFKTALPALMKQFGIKNRMAVPRITKVTVNAGIGMSLTEERMRDLVVATLEKVTGQKAVLTRAKKSIAAFKIREGMPIGVKVTLRGKRMYDFLEKLVGVALPRVRDFRGLNPSSFDGNGNASIGLREQLVFPEINADQVDRMHGFEIAITTTAANDEQGLALLKLCGFPFREK